MKTNFKRAVGNRPSGDYLTALVARKSAPAKTTRSRVSSETQGAIKAAMSVILGPNVHIRSVKLLTKTSASMPWVAQDQVEKTTHASAAPMATSIRIVEFDDLSEESAVEDSYFG